jgi:hypothetical protein
MTNGKVRYGQHTRGLRRLARGPVAYLDARSSRSANST